MKKLVTGCLCLLGALSLGACGSVSQSAENSTDKGILTIADGEGPSWAIQATANYYYNYKKSAFSGDGYDGTTNELLFTQQKITCPAKLIPPETNPERIGYVFSGWYVDNECTALWDFASATATASVFLFAGWSLCGEGEYTEPVYTPVIPEDDTLTRNLRFDGVLNVKPTYGICYLTSGGLKRLAHSPSDVRFAINYTIKSGTVLTGAVYDKDAKTVTLTSKNGESEETETLQVEQLAGNLAMSNTTYESKAKAYEEAGADKENSHIMLAGSSSVEFWTSSSEALDPIVSYNHGIGGTVSSDWDNYLLDRLVVPYCPKAVVYYVAVNDIVNSNDTSSTVLTNVQKLLNDTHAKLPNTHIFYVYVNLLAGYYLSFDPTIQAVNDGMKSFIEGKDWVEGVEAGKVLLKSTGVADLAYFRLDNLHMSEYGYVLWGAEIKKALKAWMG